MCSSDLGQRANDRDLDHSLAAPLARPPHPHTNPNLPIPNLPPPSMAWLFRKAPVELVVSIHLDKNEVEAPGAITGHVELSNSGELVVDGISIQLVGYEACRERERAAWCILDRCLTGVDARE